jgi:hypothetical protein
MCGDEMSYPIQEIFKESYGNYQATHSSYPDTNKVALSILRCKTPMMGGNLAICQDCGISHTHYNSCRNRHCPCCQAMNKEKWIDARKADVVDAPYFHAVFTVPHELNNLMFSNKRALYNLLYQSTAETLKALAKDKRHLGAQIGFISILHTWGSNLSYHPHIHVILLGGGLSKEQKFISTKTGFLFPAQVVAKLFKGKFLQGLKLLYDQGQLRFSFSDVMLKYKREFNKFYTLLNDKKWVIHIKETFKGAANVINYLGRYTHNIAISNSRILKRTPESVTFKVKDYKNGRPSTLTLNSTEFIRRFLMHVLPHRFVRIRHYGLLSNRSKRIKMALVRTLVGGSDFKPKFKDMTTLEILKELYAINPKICKECGGTNIKNITLMSIPKLE